MQMKALTFAAFVTMLPHIVSAQAQDQCGVVEAADTALQQQIALIDAAKVNVPEFFNGANSCINNNLLQSFDLSNMIPDLAGLMSGSGGIVQNLMNAAKQQVCNILNDQLQKTIGKLSGALGNFNSTLGGEMAGILGGSNITMPNIPGIGQYQFGQNNNGVNYYNPSPIQVPQFTLPSGQQYMAPQPKNSSGGNTGFSDFGRIINGGQ